MVLIGSVGRGSVAARHGIESGDVLISLNGNEIRDVLDYRFYLCQTVLDMRLSRAGKEYSVRLKKGEYDDIGLEFETYLMDKKHSCANNCVFCFIDQMPAGLRNTLYFKDDDSRLSFLQGNYITMTNLGDRDIDRMISMHLSPINISVHTTNPELRVQMLRNKNAGKSLDYMRRLYEAGIKMNCQIVLCRGINDGEELTRTMHDLASMYPQVDSVSVVPCGMTKFRDGLYHIDPFSADESAAVVRQVEDFAAKCRDYYGESIFYCGDEFYLEAGLDIPQGEYYGEYSQIENGVGMIASMRDEFHAAMDGGTGDERTRDISIATGALAYDFISGLTDEIKSRFGNINIQVYKIENDFFGRTVTVSGLVTGVDLAAQLSGKHLGDTLYIPASMLRHGGDLFLCGMSIDELADELGVSIVTVENDGYDFYEKITGGNNG
ncbi:MAG: DUF512 domain-containing protein [Clostridia bacterium]|nr:DUF512 domain-containing protein [Clostridia bacterium]